MANGFEALNLNEVISVDSESFTHLEVSSTLKLAELLEAFKEYVGSDVTEASLFDEGMECEVLKFSANNWQKGKVTFTIEFCPDEAEVAEKLAQNNLEITQQTSPLDDLRQQLKQLEHQ